MKAMCLSFFFPEVLLHFTAVQLVLIQFVPTVHLTTLPGAFTICEIMGDALSFSKLVLCWLT